MVTLTWGTLTAVTGSTVVLYDISGAATSPYDATACATTVTCIQGSSQGVGGDLTVTSLITPSTTNGVVLTMLQVLSQNAYGATSPAGVLNAPPDQNNAWPIYYNSTAAAETYIFHTNQVALTNWGANSIAFEAPTAAAGSILRHVMGTY